MKKFITAVVSALLVAALAVSFAACSSGKSLKIIDVPLSNENYGIAVQKGDPDGLLSQINEIVAKVNSTEGYEFEGTTYSFSSWMDAESAAATDNKNISIGTVLTSVPAGADEDEYFVVATNAEFPPFEYRISENEFGGVDMQLASLIAKVLGRTLVILNTDFDAVFEELRLGRVNAAMAGITITDIRKETMDFSSPYYNSTQMIAVASDDTTFEGCTTEEQVVAKLKELTGVTAGAARGQTGYYYLYGDNGGGYGFEGFSNLTVSPYRSVLAAVQDLSNGKVKLVCADKDTLSITVANVNNAL